MVSDWRRTFADNMHHIDRLYQSLPSLNVIRTTALVGAMLEAQKQSQGGAPWTHLATYSLSPLSSVVRSSVGFALPVLFRRRWLLRVAGVLVAAGGWCPGWCG